ncbi:MAG: gliding motility protein GldN [Moraxellaceae bacterium]|jgi:gliding motility associated protien GldN
MKRFILISSLIFAGLASAQEINGGPVNVPTEGVIDGVYLTEHVPTKRMIPYEFVREADVLWSKRVWRTIDMREKVNHTMYLPFDYHTPSGEYVRNSSRWSLWTILRHHIVSGELKVFYPMNPLQESMKDGDQFKYPLAAEAGKDFSNDSVFRTKLIEFQMLGKKGKETDQPLSNSFGEDSTIEVNGEIKYVYPPVDTFWYDSKDIVQYQLKEDWFFDKERSVMDVRILGLAPVIYERDQNNQILGSRVLYWVYFPHCRYILNNYFVYNEHNDANWMSFDDLFWKRQFNSTIFKESNVFDREIETYRTGVDALMESEKITEEIRNYEHDVWNF